MSPISGTARCSRSGADPDGSVDAGDDAAVCIDSDGDGRGEGCDLGPDVCEGDPHNWTAAGCTGCRDADGDGRGEGCDLGPDCDDSDGHNWTATGCTGCRDADGDGLRGTGCDLAEDCDDEALGIAATCDATGCPPGWIYVPAEDFEMGCSSGDWCWVGGPRSR